eukprot:CAMPEP_0176264246 /NCGR_PEP_ID=MMETSP0121_2-20121125/41533_1 /TAXON_ID=160619 /ORGANISM="Kryptoperidinium foliaceum, Strain CCMP 1326" /LENGTH=38 /DNA_ID= /DNA_START= /DNA_END= /DNA_ORIENTATION=
MRGATAMAAQARHAHAHTPGGCGAHRGIALAAAPSGSV